MKRSGGRRYYRPDDVEVLRLIKNLLHVKRLTIEGAQKEIKEKGIKSLIGETIQNDFFAAEEAKEPNVIADVLSELKQIRTDLQQALDNK